MRPIAGRAAPLGADDAAKTVRDVDVGTGLRGDGPCRASPSSIFPPRPCHPMLGSAGRYLRDRRSADDRNRLAGGGSRPRTGDAQRRRLDRQRRTAPARGIGRRPHPPDRDPARAFPAADRAATGPTGTFPPASCQWLPDAPAAKSLVSDMALDRDLRTSGTAAPPSPGTVEMAGSGVPALPEDALILIPTRTLVLFPGTVLPVTLGRQRSVLAAQTAMRLNRTVGLVLQRDPGIDDPIPLDLHRMGTEGSLLRYVTSPDGGHHAICQGERRFRILDFLDGYPFLAARVE